MAKTKLSQRTYGLPVNPKIGATIFYIAFALYVFFIAITVSGYWGLIVEAFAPIDVFRILRWTIWCLLGLKLLSQRYTITQILIVAFLLFLLVITWRNAGEALDMLLFVVAGQNIKIRRLAQIALPITLVIFLATIFGYYTSLLEDVQMSSDFKTAPTGRSSLGYRHPNHFGESLFAIVLAWLVINYRKLSKTKSFDVFIGITTVLLVLISATVVFVVSESETYTLGIIIAGIIYALSLKLPPRFLAFSAFVTTVAIAGFSFYAMFTFNPQVPWWNKLDSILSHRLTLPRYYFLTFPNTLFGQDFASSHISWFPDAEGGLVVDNVYCNTWLQYGIVAGIIVILLLLLIFIKSFRENRWNEATFGILVFVIIGFSETSALRFDINYFLIAMSALIFGTSLRNLEMPRVKKSKQSPVISEENPDG